MIQMAIDDSRLWARLWARLGCMLGDGLWVRIRGRPSDGLRDIYADTVTHDSDSD